MHLIPQWTSTDIWHQFANILLLCLPDKLLDLALLAAR